MGFPDRRDPCGITHEWHSAINRHNYGKMGAPEWKQWMYEARRMAEEVPRMTHLFGMERRGDLPKTHQQCSLSTVEPIQDNHLRCCLGTKCAECPQLLALESMKRVMPDEIDAAKAWTCAAHIASEGGDRMNEGYIVTVSDRMYWDRVCENLGAE